MLVEADLFDDHHKSDSEVQSADQYRINSEDQRERLAEWNSKNMESWRNTFTQRSVDDGKWSYHPTWRAAGRSAE